MSQAVRRPTSDPVAEAEAQWAESFRQQAGAPRPVENRSGIAIKPLYTPTDLAGAAPAGSGEGHLDPLGLPGEPPLTPGLCPLLSRRPPVNQGHPVERRPPPQDNAP